MTRVPALVTMQLPLDTKMAEVSDLSVSHCWCLLARDGITLWPLSEVYAIRSINLTSCPLEEILRCWWCTNVAFLVEDQEPQYVVHMSHCWHRLSTSLPHISSSTTSLSWVCWHQDVLPKILHGVHPGCHSPCSRVGLFGCLGTFSYLNLQSPSPPGSSMCQVTLVGVKQNPSIQDPLQALVEPASQSQPSMCKGTTSLWWHQC